MKLNEKDQLRFTHGFHHGNHGNAYVTQDIDVFTKTIETKDGYYQDGAILGFFCTYELDEIPMDWQELVDDLRNRYADYV